MPVAIQVGITAVLLLGELAVLALNDQRLMIKGMNNISARI